MFGLLLPSRDALRRAFLTEGQTPKERPRGRRLRGPEHLEGRLTPAVIAWLDEGLLRVSGDASNDLIVLRQKNNAITVDATLIRVGGSAQLSVPSSSVTQIVVEGREGNDTINLLSQTVGGQQAITAPTLLMGGPGDDVVAGGDGKNVIVGGEGNDKLYGGNADDNLFGGGGADQCTGNGGFDLVWGGGGGDSFARPNVDAAVDFSASGGDAWVGGFAGPAPMPTTPAQPPLGAPLPIPTNPQARLVLDSGVLFYDGTEGADSVVFVRDGVGIRPSGGQVIQTADGPRESVSVDDVLLAVGFGNGGDDEISFAGSIAPSLLFGGGGNDRLVGSAGQNYCRAYGGAGNDTILAGGGSGTILYGGSGDDRLVGSEASEILLGEAGNDTIDGGGGYNQIDGGLGTDTAIGATSSDILTSIELRKPR